MVDLLLVESRGVLDHWLDIDLLFVTSVEVFGQDFSNSAVTRRRIALRPVATAPSLLAVAIRATCMTF